MTTSALSPDWYSLYLLSGFTFFATVSAPVFRAQNWDQKTCQKSRICLVPTNQNREWQSQTVPRAPANGGPDRLRMAIFRAKKHPPRRPLDHPTPKFSCCGQILVPWKAPLFGVVFPIALEMADFLVQKVHQSTPIF